MKQANLFSFYKPKSAEQNTTATATEEKAAPAANSNQHDSDHAVKESVLQSVQQEQPLTTEKLVEKEQAQTEVHHGIIDDESKELPPAPIILQSFSGPGSSSDNSSSSSRSGVGT